MTEQRIVVIGGSAGGLSHLKAVIAALPADFAASVVVVLHIPPDAVSHLPQILGRAGPLPALHPEDGQSLQPGHVYVAVPDHHLLVEGDRIGVKRGPRENRFRPAIDTLFRSAAYYHGPRVAGVVLSGALDDGTSGLWTIQQKGGVTIVQDPDEAAFDSMPLSALNQVRIDHTLPAREIGPFLQRWATGPIENTRETAMAKTPRDTEIEIGIAAGEDALSGGVMDLGALTPFTCPECHGVLIKILEGKGGRFRCHTGHAYTESALLSGLMETVEGKYGQFKRGLEEVTMLLGDIGKRLQDTQEQEAAAVFFKRAEQLREYTSSIDVPQMRFEHLVKSL